MNLRRYIYCTFFLVSFLLSEAQIGNYISNGSFESLNTYSSSSYYNVVNYWQPIDTGRFSTYLGTTIPAIANAPQAVSGFQHPRTGYNYVVTTVFCKSCTFPDLRGYPRNRLKQQLISNQVYCVKYFIVNTGVSTLAIDSYGVYFGGSELDTINYCTIPLTYLTPQIENAAGNFITDTLNWIQMTGTFVATGNEKYMVLGNFKSDAATNTLLINPTYTTYIMGTAICIDDVSVIEVNLPAYAGPDQFMVPGDSVYLGRELDFAIDSGCTWYQLPNMSTVIRKASGLWVKPVITTTYVVRQVLDCSAEKWDTVVVYMGVVGIEKLKQINEQLKIYPVPAKDYLELKISNEKSFEDFNRIVILNNLGEIIREEEVNFTEGIVILKTDDLPDGVYSLQLKSDKSGTVSKRFVVVR